MGADMDPEIIELATKLFGFARQGDAASLASYVDAGVSPDLANDSGDTLLMLAAYHGHRDAVAALLDRDADPNRANDKGQTPLAGAVFKGENEIARLLIESGADPDGGTPSAREAAVMFGKAELLELMADY
ncbi:ankyrin repeat domain-containing protein [Nocardia sp. NPDC051052]|uniref:ankyrin repeat domain-containing protein n=1 Tax=Nocardia sp. NPDC051052 TaxID=3364322 RepID=UPI0037A6161C